MTRLDLTVQDEQRTHKDERLKISAELLKGIKILKFYAWENSFQRRISQVRAKELKAIRMINIINMGIVESSFYISAIMVKQPFQKKLDLKTTCFWS